MDRAECKTYKKHIGIMGGTFNPIHDGHIRLADNAYEQYSLDSILFMPTKTPPHKRQESIVMESYRKDMVRLAIENIPYFEFSSIELDRQGITFTYDTLLQLTEQNPDTKYYFIIGADSLFHIEEWYHSEQLLKLTELLVSTRHHYDYNVIEPQIAYLKERYGASIGSIQMPMIPISSKQIRNAVAEHRIDEHIMNYMDPRVLHYIMENNLYVRDGAI